jgi:membrane-associated phospholipid phosphatase
MQNNAKLKNNAIGLPRIASLTEKIKTLVNKALFLVAITGPDLILAGIMTGLLLFIILEKGGHIKFFQASLGLPIGIMTFLIIYRSTLYFINRSCPPNIKTILRDWLPFLLVTFIYENMHDLSRLFNFNDITHALLKLDTIIFGVEPTLWAQKFYSPLLTDIMAVFYALYFVFPLVIMFFLSEQNKRFEFREMALALTFTFLTGFVGYVIFPASPPRYFIAEMFSDPYRLHGIFIFDKLQSAWDGLSVISCGAFPSLHVGISCVALLYAWKFKDMGKIYKWIWRIFLPLVISLWVSTVYLRHHWVVDIFAGWFVACIGFISSEYILKLWNYLKKIYV